MGVLRAVGVVLFAVFFMVTLVYAGQRPGITYSPVRGVLCDRFMCADVHGLSVPLTEKYVGKHAADVLRSENRIDLTEFTFVDGIFCDVKERLCRDDRYFGLDGKRSGKINKHFSRLLFGEDYQATEKVTEHVGYIS